MRNDALFVGIIISDDSEQSALTPENYVDYLWTLKDDPDLVRIHAFAGAIPVVTCSTCNGAGFGYDDAGELTEGSQDPVVDTIQVSVDGVLRVLGWSYTGHVADGGSNEIEFDDPLPVASVVVEVSYTVTAACE